MSNRYRELISLCTDILASYHSEKVAINEHLQNFLSRSDSYVQDDPNWTFISETVTGVIHYKILIEVVVDGFYAKDGKTYLQADKNLFNVISYLIMFRLDEIGMSSFKKLVCTQHIGKMHKFLSFLCAKDNLTGWINNELCRVYDPEFVKSSIISPVLRCYSEIDELIHHLSDRLANRSATKTTTRAVTESKPFNLTKPNARSIPISVDEVPMVKTSRGVPETTYNTPLIQHKLSKAFQDNKEIAECNLLEAERIQFTCSNPKKSEKTQRIMKQIEQEREARLRTNPLKPTPIPSTLNESQEVKLNTAVILREGARIQKEEDNIDRHLTRLEAGEGDMSQFNKWQDEMRHRDATKKAAEVERKHLDGQLSYEEAIIAKQKYISQKKESAKKFRDESRKLQKEYFAHKNDEKLEMRRLVEATMTGFQNAREARSRLTTMKKQIVQNISEENRQLMALALEEEEIEMRRKAELINQIRAMEKVPIIRTNFVDLTETSGQGYICEMSIAELRERISLMKLAEEDERRSKRKAIKLTKKVKQHVLNDTIKNISRYKEEKAKQTMTKQDDEKEELMENTAHQFIKEPKLCDMQDKLENKRRERKRLQQQPSQISSPSKQSESSTVNNDFPSSIALPSMHTRTSRQQKLTSRLSSSKPGRNMLTVIPPTPPVDAIETLMRAASRT